MSYFSVLSAYSRIAYQVYFLNNFYTKRLFNALKKETHLQTDSLTVKQKERIFYYTSQCFIVASWTSTLRGTKLSREEKKSVIALGALTPLIDDLTDDHKMKSEEIIASLSLKRENNSKVQALAKYLFQYLYRKHGETFLAQFQLVLAAQEASLQQSEKKALSSSLLKEITYNKGAKSILLYRGILENPVNEKEKEAFEVLGYATQLVNDQFDIYKDYKNQVQSPYTNSKNLKTNYEEYLEVINQVVEKFRLLPYPKKNKERCILEISTILSRGLVCINQLLSLKESTLDTFKLESYSRKELVCDMEKPKNVLQSILYSKWIFQLMRDTRKG